MSVLVGSTPSLTRNGRPRASFSFNSPSLMIWTAPRFKDANASPACMIGNSSGAGDRGQSFPRSYAERLCLFILVQQLTNLIDREWRVLPIQRFLTLTLLSKNALVFGVISS